MIVAAGRTVAPTAIAPTTSTAIAPSSAMGRRRPDATRAGRRVARGFASGRTTGTGRVASSAAGAVTLTAASVGADSSVAGPRTTWIVACDASDVAGAGAASPRRASSTLAWASMLASAASDRVSASPTIARSRPSASAARARSRSATALEVARDRPGATTITRPGSAARTRRTTAVISSSASRYRSVGDSLTGPAPARRHAWPGRPRTRRRRG